MQLKMYRNVGVALVMALLVAACGNDKPAETKAPAAPVAEKAAGTAAPAVEAEQAVLRGKVVETFVSGGYTYALVDDSAEQIWVATAETPMSVGEEVAFADGQVMQGFYSTSLDRTFDKIVFASGVMGQGAASMGSAAMGQPGADSFDMALQGEGGGMGQFDPMGGSMGSSKAVVDFADLKVEKAAGENAFTVGEIYAKAAEISGQKIQLRGQVVKVSPNIMGKNWLHIQDGTGDPATASHDLVVTTAELPNMGDIVTLEGVVAVNKDFGYGYNYAVIVEEAVVKQ